MDVFESVAGTVSRIRGGRILHPSGRTFAGELQVDGSTGWTWGAALLDRPGRYRATVRLSKSVGTPVGWPDVLGLALRVHDERDGDADLLLSSTARPPLIRHLPVPGFTFAGTCFGSLLAYRTGPVEAAHRVYLGAVGRRSAEGIRFQMYARRPRGGWRAFGMLRPGEALPAGADARVAFDPTVSRRRDLHVAGVVQQLRGIAYRASQRGRPARCQQS